MPFKKLVLFTLILAYLLCACGPSQAELDATATQEMANVYATQTAAPTATPLPTPTPVPGTFLNAPEDLESTYFPDGLWDSNDSGWRMGAISIKDDIMSIGMAGYKDDSAILMRCAFRNSSADLAELIDDELTQERKQEYTEEIVEKFTKFIPNVLDHYLTLRTQKKMFEFVEENTDYPEISESEKSPLDAFGRLLGEYEAEIDGFDVYYSISVLGNDPIMTLMITQNP